MEIQQRDNETFTAYVHQFKTEARRCDFNSDTTIIHIFVNGLQDEANLAEKNYEKDPQMLLEVIKFVEKLNAAQTVTATLVPPTVNMISNDDRCFECAKSGHIGHHCPST